MDDAFGAALLEYQQDGETNEYVTEREDGEKARAKISHYFDPYDEWEPLTKTALDHIREEDTVLDIGCGAGRQALWLQDEGHEVVAIDSSPKAIEVCRNRGVEECAVMDMSDLNFPDSKFDTVLIIGTILGLGGSLDHVTDLLSELDRITTDDGRIIADSQDPFAGGTIDEYFIDNRIEGRDATSLQFRVRYGKLIGEWLEILFIGQDEMRNNLVAQTPWTVSTMLTAGPDEGWYSLNAEWYFVVLDKG